ncbi:hypothetical protein K470DRAFT_256580 [Piedraia hortae CBS 480.64]|uniref:MYND-type domain-containing protein n=1 Tax=Piedraia hortae CBS 480.64 TaxID=1314780 RepID=A0A6A7C4T8_9PEZI|nr:hypothetical protein K470DRAFT_256580 [Piedraia hortae CBS 480.64]
MDALMAKFKAIPRPRTTSSGMPNHWIFGIFKGFKDHNYAYALHFKGEAFCVAGPEEVMSSAGLDPAKEAAERLLRAFKNLYEAADTAYGPWTWSTMENTQLSNRIENILRKYEAPRELQSIGRCHPAEIKTLQRSWEEFNDGVVQEWQDKQNAQVTCAHCLVEEYPHEVFKCCARCLNVRYCSKACQRSHWSSHRYECKNSKAVAEAYLHYLNKAPNIPEACVLGEALGMALPMPSSVADDFTPQDIIKLVLCRLVVTGHDTPENFQLFFGRFFRGALGKLPELTRILVLLKPDPGSPLVPLRKQADKQAPYTRPRTLSSREIKLLQMAAKAKVEVRQRGMGVATISTKEWKEMVRAWFDSPDSWVYSLALSSMDTKALKMPVRK